MAVGSYLLWYARQEQSGPTPADPRGGEPAGQPRQQVGIYYNNGPGRLWTQQVLTQYPDPAAGGFNSKVGVIGTDRLPSILTANHGYLRQPNPVVLFCNTTGARTSGTTWPKSTPLGASSLALPDTPL